MCMCSFVRVCMQTFIFTRTAIASEISWHKNEMDDESSSVDSRKPPTNQPTNQPASERASSQRDLLFSFCVQSTYICMYVCRYVYVAVFVGREVAVSQLVIHCFCWFFTYDRCCCCCQIVIVLLGYCSCCFNGSRPRRAGYEWVESEISFTHSNLLDNIAQTNIYTYIHIKICMGVCVCICMHSCSAAIQVCLCIYGHICQILPCIVSI